MEIFNDMPKMWQRDFRRYVAYVSAWVPSFTSFTALATT